MFGGGSGGHSITLWLFIHVFNFTSFVNNRNQQYTAHRSNERAGELMKRAEGMSMRQQHVIFKKKVEWDLNWETFGPL